MSLIEHYFPFYHYQWLIYYYFKDIIDNFDQKKYVIKKFQELKKGTSLFNNFYFKFIWLASDFHYILEILIMEFKYQLTPCLLDQLNLKIEFVYTISTLVKHYLGIYE